MDIKTFKTIRQGMGWSQEKLGEYLGVSLMTVFRMENGKSPIRRATKIAMDHLHEKTNEIMG